MMVDDIASIKKLAGWKEDFIKHFESEMQNTALPRVERVVRDELFWNLTDYDHAKVESRSDELRKIFDVLHEQVGFEFNPDGSFTEAGANEVMEKELRTSGSYHGRWGWLSFTAEGRLNELERGQTSWKSLKDLFQKRGFQKRLIGQYGIAGYLEIKHAAEALFEKTLVDKRPYLGKAFEMGEFWMHSEIASAIESMEGVKRV